ncbi:MAG: hypothetical protein WCA49_25345 [Candidatus Sulfotelmatobacter sp.]
MGDLVWYIPTPLILLLLCLLVRRGEHRTFPYFFAYVVFSVAASAMRFFTRNHHSVYFWVYWLTDVGYALLGALAMYEILRKALRGFAHIWWRHLVFPAVVVIGVGLSLWHLYKVPPRLQGRLLIWIVTGEIAVRYVQVLTFIGLGVLAALALFYGLRWRQYALGISVGFGLYAAVALLITTKLSDVGRSFTFLWNVISIVAYSFAVLIWIGFLFLPEVEELPPDSDLVSRRMASEAPTQPPPFEFRPLSR